MEDEQLQDELSAETSKESSRFACQSFPLQTSGRRADTLGYERELLSVTLCLRRHQSVRRLAKTRK